MVRQSKKIVQVNHFLSLLFSGIVSASTALLDYYWKDLNGDSDWLRANEAYKGIEEGYDIPRDEISSVSSYNPSKGILNRAFGSSLSLQSSIGRSSNHDRTSISSYLPLPQLSVAEFLYDSGGGKLFLKCFVTREVLSNGVFNAKAKPCRITSPQMKIWVSTS